MYCTECGTKLAEDAGICPNCQADLTLQPDFVPAAEDGTTGEGLQSRFSLPQSGPCSYLAAWMCLFALLLVGVGIWHWVIPAFNPEPELPWGGAEFAGLTVWEADSFTVKSLGLEYYRQSQSPYRGRTCLKLEVVPKSAWHSELSCLALAVNGVSMSPLVLQAAAEHDRVSYLVLFDRDSLARMRIKRLGTIVLDLAVSDRSGHLAKSGPVTLTSSGPGKPDRASLKERVRRFFKSKELTVGFVEIKTRYQGADGAVIFHAVNHGEHVLRLSAAELSIGSMDLSPEGSLTLLPHTEGLFHVLCPAKQLRSAVAQAEPHKELKGRLYAESQEPESAGQTLPFKLELESVLR